MKLTTSSAFRNQPKFSFQGKSELKDKRQAPGPGQYVPVGTEKDKFNCSQKWSMGHAPEPEKPFKGTPGPGQYTNKFDPRFKDQPKWGFGSGPKLGKSLSATSPGPCKYDTRGNLEGQQSSMSFRAEGSKRAVTPGPGAYKPTWEPTLAASQRYSFGSSSRPELAMSKTPGPGHYSSMSTLGGNPVVKTPGKYSMTYRHKLPTGDITPGPPSAGTTFT